MLPLETKQSGGKLLPHSDIRRGGVFLEEVLRSRKRNRDVLLGTWNVRSLYSAGALMAAARELARYKLDLVGVQEVRWEKEGTVKAGDYSFFYGNYYYSVALVRERTIPTERPPPVGEVSANFCG